MAKLKEVAKKYNIELKEIWECSVHKLLKDNKEMKDFFKEIPDKGIFYLFNFIYYF